MALKFKSELLSEIECPICLDTLSIPIRECETGHSVCAKCQDHFQECPLCACKITDVRNYTLESIVFKIQNLSDNEYSQWDQHEFKFKCQWRNCSFIGEPVVLKVHWKENHIAYRMYTAFNKCKAKIRKNSNFVNLVEAFCQMFWFKSKMFNNMLYYNMQYIGKSEDAHKFFYQIEITHETLYNKKIIMNDYCKSISLTDEELFKEDICCVIPMNSQFLIHNEAFTEFNYIMKVYQAGVKPRQNNRKWHFANNTCYAQSRTQRQGQLLADNNHKSKTTPNLRLIQQQPKTRINQGSILTTNLQKLNQQQPITRINQGSIITNELQRINQQYPITTRNNSLINITDLEKLYQSQPILRNNQESTIATNLQRINQQHPMIANNPRSITTTYAQRLKQHQSISRNHQSSKITTDLQSLNQQQPIIRINQGSVIIDELQRINQQYHKTTRNNQESLIATNLQRINQQHPIIANNPRSITTTDSQRLNQHQFITRNDQASIITTDLQNFNQPHPLTEINQGSVITDDLLNLGQQHHLTRNNQESITTVDAPIPNQQQSIAENNQRSISITTTDSLDRLQHTKNNDCCCCIIS